MKQALTHQSSKTQPYYIPTPEAAEAVTDHGDLYPTNYKVSKSYVKLATLGDDPLTQFPKYNLDSLDEEFLRKLRKAGSIPAAFNETVFEWIIDCLEESAHRLSESVVTTESIERLRDKFSSSIPDEAATQMIIDHWKQRRAEGRFTPFLRHEDLGKIGADPYVCFRRRELKIPRKTRRSDAQINDRLKKLHLDLTCMRLMLQAAIKRDRYKREALVLEGELFERYRLVENWRKHNKTEWPAQLVSFKTAAQSLLETKKKKSRVDEGIVAGEMGHPAYKIAIPVAVLKSTRHSLPYYPHEISKAIQKDMDAVLGHSHDEAKIVRELCDDPLELTGLGFEPCSWLQGKSAAFRKARGNRLVIDREYRRKERGAANRHASAYPSKDFNIQYHTKLLAARDFSQLQTPVGNYNIHAVQSANQILRPMSFPAWVAATAPIIASLSAPPNKPKSPKKRKRPDDDSSLGDSPTVEISKLAGNNSQITVKVNKSTPKESQKKVTGARFTPHGLAHEGKTSSSPTKKGAQSLTTSVQSSMEVLPPSAPLPNK